MPELLHYFTENSLEILGFVFGIVYVLLAARQNVWCWIAGIINVTLYIIIFYRSGLYGDSALQVFYLGISIYGLYSWLYRKKGQSGLLQITHTTRELWGRLFFLTSISTILFGYLLDNFTDSVIPYLDGFTTALGVYATWMTARKLLENWHVWIFTNIVCTGVYFYKELYTTMVFYFILAILAYNGLVQWKKQMQLQ